jgi:hypothetical protein
MDGSTEPERRKLPKHLLLSQDEYVRQPNLDRYYSVAKQGDMIELGLDYPPPGLSDDPRYMQIMFDMHFDSLMRHGSLPALYS